MSIEPIRIIFAGTPEFAVPSLKTLLEDDNFRVSAIITQPDKKRGRKQILTSPPVKQVAEKHSIPVYQPDNINNISNELKEYQPDILVVVAYAQKIPSEILNIPRYGCFNVHSSLLPQYRGAAAIQAPILHGDKESGVTIIKMNEGLDTGDILKQEEITLSPTETYPSLHKKLAELGANVLPFSLLGYIKGEMELSPQNEDQATYVSSCKKQDGHLDWRESAEIIERKIRAFQPWPGTYSCVKHSGNKKIMIKVLEVEHQPLKINDYPSGTLFMDDKENLCIQCQNNALKIIKIQPEGKSSMNGKEFIRGYKDLLGKPLE